jgi:protein-S-isoprenylcysteine O-methyltransferase Ste14
MWLKAVFWLGIVVRFGSPVLAAVFISLTGIAIAWIIPKEEKALEKQFGEEYMTSVVAKT